MKELQHLISNNKTFCFIRLPYSKEILILSNDYTTERNKVSFYDHKGEEKYGFNELIDVLSIEEFESLKSISFPFSSYDSSPYIDNFIDIATKAIQELKENKLKKVVLSRKIIKEVETLDLIRIFSELYTEYEISLNYLLIGNQEIWIGATPELLGFRQKNHFFTIALAGTLPNDNASKFSFKESYEHQLVVDYIEKKLSPFSQETKISRSDIIKLKNIKHLKTDIQAVINPEDISQIIKAIHPTPAVCGISKEKATQFIQENEGYDRELYTGYIAINLGTEDIYYVNLRCAKIYRNTIEVFVGAGITKDSIPEDELKETELKSEVFLKRV